MKSTLQAPPAQLTLPGHPSSPVGIEVAYQSAARRFLLAALSLAGFWGVIPWVLWVPPHYPWPVVCFVAGLYLAHRFWTGRYRVRTFAGSCPRCGRWLRLPSGSKINLPHTFTCYGCHFEPSLEVIFDPRPLLSPTGEPVWIRHRSPDCAGRWTLRRVWSNEYLRCDRCGSLHPATPEARQAAEEDNGRGMLLEQLASEGRFLI